MKEFVVIQSMILLVVLILYRNNQVFKERERKLREISRRIDLRILQGIPWRHLFDIFDEVTYSEMLLKFWIWPIRKMWEDGEY